jgi:putative membrane protein
MFVSSTYELIEWWVSVFSGEAGDSFLGTQGYIWDTQTDMLMALIGGIVAQLFLSKALQKNINRLL